MRLLLLFIFAFTGLAAGPPQVVIAGDDWFKVEFIQDDKPVEIVNHTVRLKKDKYSMLISLNHGGSISVNASLDSANLVMAKDGKSLQEFECFLPGTGMAEGLGNKENDMNVNALAHNYWYYENDDKHRFNKIEKKGDWIVCERVIKKIWVFDNEISDAFKVNQFPKDIFYMVFMKTTFDVDNTIELQRDYVRVIFSQ